jgi:hypothetical protein
MEKVINVVIIFHSTVEYVNYFCIVVLGNKNVKRKFQGRSPQTKGLRISPTNVHDKLAREGNDYYEK